MVKIKDKKSTGKGGNSEDGTVNQDRFKLDEQ